MPIGVQLEGERDGRRFFTIQIHGYLLARSAALAEVAEHVHALEQYCVTKATADLRKQVAERLG